MSPEPVLHFEGVHKSFATARGPLDALRGITLHLPPGRVTGLIGPDGAGKTTLMRLAAGLLLPDSGHITAVGLDVVKQPLAVQGTIGYMPQRFGLYEDLTVQENLDLYADLRGVPRAARAQRYAELTRMTGLASFSARLAERLSGGMKQKLGLACALVRPAPLLLLDEPTVGVDPVSRRELWAIISRFVAEEGTSVLLSTAYLDEAERCAHVIILHEGELLDQGPPAAFRERMRGRTFALTARGLRNRTVQEVLAGRPGVTDAIIQGDHVRLVTENTTPPEADRLLPGRRDVHIETTPPRFEDSFIAMLRHRADAPPAPSTTTAPAAAAPARPVETVVEVQDVKRRFGDFYAVKGVSFHVARGEIFGLLGANGAGKTTTFRMLCGLLPPSEGHLFVAGVDVRRTAAAARARIGYMSQKFSLYGNLGVLQNLQFFSSAYGLRGARRAERIAWALREFQLQGSEQVTSSALSLGYKQRLALACALMHEPDILFLDEPTSGVDPLARREFWRRINNLAENGITVLVTTHFMEEAEYCDRMAIMVRGHILAVDTPRRIKERARCATCPSPTMEEAFIALIQEQTTPEARA